MCSETPRGNRRNESGFPINPGLYSAVFAAKASIVLQFKNEGVDPNSEAFLARFPFVFVEGTNGEGPTADPIRESLVKAAFTEEFRSRTQEVINIFYANWSGGTPEYYFLNLINDFLNYALPRSLGLPDEDAVFEALYRQFEADLFTDSYTLHVIALLKNAYDHGGRFHPTSGLSFFWADSNPRLVLNSSRLRNRAVPFLEIKKSAHPSSGGTDISTSHSFFVLEFEEKRKKKKDAPAEAYRRSEEIAKKTVLALRLLTAAPAYAEYRGFRTLGHYSGGSSGMALRNYPGERIDRGFGSDAQSWGHGLERLFPPLLAAPMDSIAVLYDKIDDAFRRQQQRGAPFDGVSTKPAIDQLLDYFQSLEAIIPIEGSYQIALYAAVLLRAANRGLGLKAIEVFEFVKDMHKLRNEVVHGRIDNVLLGRGKTTYKIADIGRFRQYVHELAILYLLNPDEKGKHDLRGAAHRLAVGEDVNLRTLYTP
jgi:hypothetical protein